MRLANVSGRIALVRDSYALDVAHASDGVFGPDPMDVFENWAAFTHWVEQSDPSQALFTPVDEATFEAIVPRPRQIFAIGLNYIEHANETGIEKPKTPLVFTKFVSSITGPHGVLTLPTGTVDWEVELVAVIGSPARNLTHDVALSHVAGLTIAQDLSERTLQFDGAPPQFSLGKSYPGFCPIGPYLVTLDEMGDTDKVRLGSWLNGEQVQDGLAGDMLFSLPELLVHLSSVCSLFPGDLVLTGTPPGVGMGRTPPLYLREGDVLESRIAGLGSMRHTFVAPTRQQ